MALPRGNGPFSRTLREHDAALRRARILVGPNQTQVQTTGGVMIVPKPQSGNRRQLPFTGRNVWL
jgi:hypothetical protein